MYIFICFHFYRTAETDHLGYNLARHLADHSAYNLGDHLAHHLAFSQFWTIWPTIWLVVLDHLAHHLANYPPTVLDQFVGQARVGRDSRKKF